MFDFVNNCIVTNMATSISFVFKDVLYTNRLSCVHRHKTSRFPYKSISSTWGPSEEKCCLKCHAHNYHCSALAPEGHAIVCRFPAGFSSALLRHNPSTFQRACSQSDTFECTDQRSDTKASWHATTSGHRPR